MISSEQYFLSVSFPYEVRPSKTIDIMTIYSILYHERGKDFYYPEHSHDLWEMVYCDSGEVLLAIENEERRVSQSQIIFHKPYEKHATIPHGKSHHNILIFTFTANSPAVKFFEGKVLNTNTKERRILSTLFAKAIELIGKGALNDSLNYLNAEDGGHGTQQLMLNYFEILLIELMQSNSSGPVILSNDNSKNEGMIFIESLKEYLYKNKHSRVSILDVCKEFGVSRTYVSQLFRKATGKSIIEFFLALKIEDAKNLIKDGKLNVTQISERLGYQNVYYFSASFKRITGMSPSEYAKSIKTSE